MGTSPKSEVASQTAFEELIKSISQRLRKIKYRIAVISGKGGVGKSFISASLALGLALRKRRVGLLDADLHGPSIPKILGLEGRRLIAGPPGIFPVEGPLGVKVVSIQFLLESEDSPVIWRGPLKSRAIMEFLSGIVWGELDYLIIDLPPGTGDEVLSIAQWIRPFTGAVVVTIPSELSKTVVKKAIRFCKVLNMSVLGIVENMSEFYCPDTGKTYKVFGKGVGQELAREYAIKYLGSIPLDPRISEANDKGEPFLLKYSDSPSAKALMEIVDKIIAIVEGRGT
ncbi:MAG: ATP-binding protein [Desulfurococcales archaeon ex4484_42]|nr:MAG: ATP-binding protein [Desulfurococcales archaeon ex4484_42]